MNDEKKMPWTGECEVNGKMIMAPGLTNTFDGTVYGVIAVCRDTFQTDFENRAWSTGGSPEANAQLFAAAPELAKALHSLVQMKENYSPFGGELYEDRIERVWDEAVNTLCRAGHPDYVKENTDE
jgi:hypothetical protein